MTGSNNRYWCWPVSSNGTRAAGFVAQRAERNTTASHNARYTHTHTLSNQRLGKVEVQLLQLPAHATAGRKTSNSQIARRTRKAPPPTGNFGRLFHTGQTRGGRLKSMMIIISVAFHPLSGGGDGPHSAICPGPRTPSNYGRPSPHCTPPTRGTVVSIQCDVQHSHCLGGRKWRDGI